MENFLSSPIHRLVESDDHLEELREFLEKGGDPNLRVFGSSTLLHEAAQSCKWNCRTVKELINAGADVELTTNVGSTALQFAVMSRNRCAVQVLIQAGANTNAQNSFGRTALHYAIHSCQPRHRSQLPWMRAVHRFPDIWILKTLLDHSGADVNSVDSKGETPLIWATRYGSFDAVKKLLVEGANPSISNQQAQNALHVALYARKPNHDIITELLRNGAGVYDVDHFGRTPIDILLQNVLSDSTLLYVMECLALIALKYRIRESLESKIRPFPQLLEFFRSARQEVEYMNKQIIYDKVTLHDFVSGCFQERRGGDPTLEIYKPVVEILLSKHFVAYLVDILVTVSIQGLYNVVVRTIPPSHLVPGAIIAALFSNYPHMELYRLIMDYYIEILRQNVEQ